MKITRRTLIQRASIGVAAAGAFVAAPHLLSSQDRSAGVSPRDASSTPRVAVAGGAPQATSEPLIAYVRDSVKGEIALYVGNREIIRQDPELVARLLQAGA